MNVCQSKPKCVQNLLSSNEHIIAGLSLTGELITLVSSDPESLETFCTNYLQINENPYFHEAFKVNGTVGK